MTTDSRASAGEHVPVMSAEALAGLALRAGALCVDGTVGMGGHLLQLAGAVGEAGRVIGFDLDPEALAAVKALLGGDRLGDGPGQVTLVHDSFENMAAVLAHLAPDGVDAIFLDLGVSRDQLISGRFSFQGDGPLDFRLDSSRGESAAELLARLPEAALADLIFEYGDERFARRIARGVVEARRSAPLRTAAELVEVIRRAYPANARHGRIHLATRTFQALRMACNGMMTALEKVLQDAPRLLKPQGRLGILTYHSGEDGRTKRAFRELARSQGYQLITPKPLKPSEAECRANPSARSARLRILAAPER